MASTGKTPPTHRPPPSGPEGRSYVSPLGGATAPFATNLQLRQERLNRAQSARTQSARPPEMRPPRNGQQGPRRG
jgi:hypothetical protein